MTTELPKVTVSNKTGRRAVTILQDRLEKEGWIFRRQDGDSDFGVDGEIEIVDKNCVTGRLVKCQIKGSRKIEFDDGETSVRVKVRTYDLWQAIPLPTILFPVDTKSKYIYWTVALAHHPKRNTKSLRIRFEKTSELSADFGTLQAYLDSWFASRGSDSILYEIQAFHRHYQELTKILDGYDDWSEMNDDDDHSFRLYYAHALRLRLAVGLSNADLPTFDDWLMRNQDMWNSVYPLFWGTFNEAMKIIGPAYEEALNRIRERLQGAKLNVENQMVWSFMQQLRSGRHTQYAMTDERAADARFHARLEAKLKDFRGLKYKFADRKQDK